MTIVTAALPAVAVIFRCRCGKEQEVSSQHFPDPRHCYLAFKDVTQCSNPDCRLTIRIATRDIRIWEQGGYE